MICKRVCDGEAVLLFVMPAVACDTCWYDSFSVVELQVLTAIEQDDLLKTMA